MSDLLITNVDVLTNEGRSQGIMPLKLKMALLHLL